jgi:hypothetical protein
MKYSNMYGYYLFVDYTAVVYQIKMLGKNSDETMIT